MWRSLPQILRFCLTASTPGDVAFKLAVLVILSPVIVVLCVVDGVYEKVVRR
jgi:hypothetical protein